MLRINCRTWQICRNHRGLCNRGKVISSDQAGNVYKSLYIYDETSQSGIELKLMVSNYVYYHMGQTIYVKTKGMALGNYRYMISLGMPPTEADIEKTMQTAIWKPTVDKRTYLRVLWEN